MSPITTHVLDTAQGKPAQGLPISLEKKEGEQWQLLASGVTNADGRIAHLLEDDHVLTPGLYRMTFTTSAYFELEKVTGFYPYVEVVFELQQPAQHYHIPLLLSPYGYSTYRGS